jgi:PadR family transcriptional regulator, regulatory protein PadR
MALREPTVFILTALARGRLHGYGILGAVEDLSDGRITLSTGTLYGALERLERDGYVAFDGEETDGGPPRRYYALTASGRELLTAEVEQMRATASTLDAALRKGTT